MITLCILFAGILFTSGLFYISYKYDNVIFLILSLIVSTLSVLGTLFSILFLLVCI